MTAVQIAHRRRQHYDVTRRLEFLRMSFSGTGSASEGAWQLAQDYLQSCAASKRRGRRCSREHANRQCGVRGCRSYVLPSSQWLRPRVVKQQAPLDCPASTGRCSGEVR